MAGSHTVTINDKSFIARRGELLLDAALNNGIEIPFDCRAGHCGACCVNLTEGRVHGGEGSSPGVIHACQARIVSNATISSQSNAVRTVQGQVMSLRPLSSDVMEVGIRTDRALPYLPGQFAKLHFKGFPSRCYSLTHPLQARHARGTVWFHIRAVEGGQVSTVLGSRIRVGHPCQIKGGYGQAYFRPDQDNRLILVSTGTGFAPIWGILAAALHENPERKILLIVGGRNLDALYMGPILGKVSRFPNTRVVPVCSKSQTASKSIKLGRPTDAIPRLHKSDVVYVCGAPPMVDSVKELADSFGASCFADPFVQQHGEEAQEEEREGLITRALSWLPLPTEAARRRLEIANRRQLRLPPQQRSRARARAAV